MNVVFVVEMELQQVSVIVMEHYLLCGICYESNLEDYCGVCDSDPNNDCQQDCQRMGRFARV